MSYFIDDYLYLNYELLGKKFINAKEFEKFKATFSITEKQVGKAQHFYKKVIKSYSLEMVDGIKYMKVPRHNYNLLKTVNLIDTKLKDDKVIVVKKIKRDKLEQVQQLYDYQATVVDHLYELYKTRSVCYLHMGTGLGKTKTTCGLIAKLCYKAIIVVPTIALAGQWIVDCNEMYPNLRIVRYTSTTIVPSHDILVCVINTFRTTEFPPGYFIVFDEAHELSSKENIKALIATVGNYCLGLSASPLERPDNLDRAVELYLGKVIYAESVPGTDIGAVKFDARVNKISYYGNPKYCETQYTEAKGEKMVSCINTIKHVLEDESRTNLIVLCVRQILLQRVKHGIFIFAETRDYLKILSRRLIDYFPDTTVETEAEAVEPEVVESPEVADDKVDDTVDGTVDDSVARDLTKEDLTKEEWISNKNVSLIMGGTTADDMGIVKGKKNHIVLTTYGFGRRGISLVDMTALIMCSPRKNGLNQIIGRIMRRGSDQTIIREIYDIVDVRSMLKYQFKEREKVYSARKYPIIDNKYWWDDRLLSGSLQE